MNHALVRFSEIGTKSPSVMGRMVNRLRDRVEERLEHEGLPYDSVETVSGRVAAETGVPREAAMAASDLPGVASVSPALRVEPAMDAILAASDRFEVGDTFGVDTNVAFDPGFSTRDVNEAVGARIAERTGADVDLDDPDTRIEVDVRREGAYLFAERFEGPGGFPVGSQAPLGALVSGGIDSPVAAYEVMTRGADVAPIYFYNRPLAAGDHLARVEAALAELRRFHPAKGWEYHRLDMAAANEALMDVGEGRMLLHRAVLFRAAARVAEGEGLAGLVTGESIGQKSSQTSANLALTASRVDLPVFRPLLSRTKESIVEEARELGTFEAATVDAACRTIAPDSPATRMDPERFAALAREVDLDALVAEVRETHERVPVPGG